MKRDLSAFKQVPGIWSLAFILRCAGSAFSRNTQNLTLEQISVLQLVEQFYTIEASGIKIFHKQEPA